MTAADLRKIVLSTDFKTGLDELSSYLASIMQEAPIVHLLAKCLWKRKHLYALERYKRHDLTVWESGRSTHKDVTTIEFKFNYETCSSKLQKELEKLAEHLDLSDKSGTSGMKLSKWGVMRGICKDICEKKPDLFVWIVCSRDLTGLNDNDLERIVNWRPFKQYRRVHPYKSDREFLETVDGFLQLLQHFRPFSVSTAEIETNGYFPSTYHFRICEFTQL